MRQDNGNVCLRAAGGNDLCAGELSVVVGYRRDGANLNGFASADRAIASPSRTS